MNHPDDDLIDALTRALAEHPSASELTAPMQDRMKSRIAARIRDVGPDGTTTIRATDGEWQDFLPLIQRKVLRTDERTGNQTAFYRLRPGARLPSHVHTQQEECLVLEGEVRIGDDFIVRAGDFHVAEPGFAHPESVSVGGALLFIRSQLFERRRRLDDVWRSTIGVGPGLTELACSAGCAVEAAHRIFWRPCKR